MPAARWQVDNSVECFECFFSRFITIDCICFYFNGTFRDIEEDIFFLDIRKLDGDVHPFVILVNFTEWFLVLDKGLPQLVKLAVDLYGALANGLVEILNDCIDAFC